jgi:hypothetical protein
MKEISGLHDQDIKEGGLLEPSQKGLKEGWGKLGYAFGVNPP